MAPGAATLDAMSFETGSPAVSIHLEEVISGFWMGARMWRGRIDIGNETAPGAYLVLVFGKEDRKKVEANTFLIAVYKDRASYLAASKSLVTRYLGVSPWMAAGFFFSLPLVACACLYLVSGKKERLMAELGEAEVFHVTRDEAGTSIYFGLGRLHGIQGGSELQLLDSERRTLGIIKVESVSDTNAMAVVSPDSEVRSGYLVKKI